jgi:hypothetical protein
VLGDVRVRRAVLRMMQVVKLADSRDAGLEHFHVGQRRDGLELLGRELLHEAVHRVAP